jgi:UDP-4-amino-4,6-dideoxy-N-acetyl-beta-L-altrosamine transaminase
MIPYGRQEIVQSDIDAVVNILQSDFLTQGPTVPLFEKKLCDYTGVKYGIAVNSGTSALHLACLALGLEKGDWLWTSPITFVASANCGLYCGAKIDFVDIDPKTYNLSAVALEEKLIQAEKNGKLPKILIPVHLCGQSCDMKKIHELSQKYGFKIIEDASHAIGGKYLKKPIGNCQFSDITVFSFHPVKIITTAEGGMVTTNCARLASRMELLRSHGITRDPKQMTHVPDCSWYYQQIELGFNYRMNDIQAALGISQLERLDYYVSRRHILADRYDILLADLPLDTPYQHSDAYSPYHLYVICLKENNSVAYHRKFFESLREKGIGVNLHYIPIYSQPYYQNFGFDKKEFPNAEKYYENAISLPLFPTMDDEIQNRVIEAIKQVIYEEH